MAGRQRRPHDTRVAHCLWRNSRGPRQDRRRRSQRRSAFLGRTHEARAGCGERSTRQNRYGRDQRPAEVVITKLDVDVGSVIENTKADRTAPLASISHLSALSLTAAVDEDEAEDFQAGRFNRRSAGRRRKDVQGPNGRGRPFLRAWPH